MNDLELRELFLVDGNVTETTTTTTMDGNATTATTAPNPSPTAPSPTGDSSPASAPASAPASVPTAPESVPTEGLSPAMAPESFPSASVFTAPESVPTEDYLSPVMAPESFPSLTKNPPFPVSTYGDDMYDTGISPTLDNSPTASTSNNNNDIGSMLTLTPFKSMILIAVIVGVVTLLLFWNFCKAWKVRREKQRLRLQSTRVDAVLGDMQMVGMDEYDDDDPELI